MKIIEAILKAIFLVASTILMIVGCVIIDDENIVWGIVILVFGSLCATIGYIYLSILKD